MDKELGSKLKSMKCEDRYGRSTSQRDKDKALDKSCTEIEVERDELKNVPALAEQAHQEGLAKQQEDANRRIPVAQQQNPIGGLTAAQVCAMNPASMGCSGLNMNGQLQFGQQQQFPGQTNAAWVMPQSSTFNAGLGNVSSYQMG